MAIDAFKEFVVKKPGMTGDCEKTGQIINRSIKLLKERHLSYKSKIRLPGHAKPGINGGKA